MLNLSIVDWWVFLGKKPQILCVFRLEGIRGFVCIVYVRAKEGLSQQLWERIEAGLIDTAVCRLLGRE